MVKYLFVFFAILPLSSIAAGENGYDYTRLDRRAALDHIVSAYSLFKQKYSDDEICTYFVQSTLLTYAIILADTRENLELLNRELPVPGGSYFLESPKLTRPCRFPTPGVDFAKHKDELSTRSKNIDRTFAELVELSTKALGAKHPLTAFWLFSYADSLFTSGQDAQANAKLLTGIGILHDYNFIDKTYRSLSIDIINKYKNGRFSEQLSQAASFGLSELIRVMPNAQTDTKNVIHGEAAKFDSVIHANRLNQSEEEKRRSLEIFQLTLGDGHRKTIDRQIDLAAVYINNDFPEKALPLLKSALIGHPQDAHEKLDPQLVNILNSLALVYFKLGRYEDAISIQSKLLVSFEAANPPDFVNIATAAGNLANSYAEIGDYLTAKKFHIQALNIWKANPNSSDSNIGESYANLATTHSLLGEHQVAVDMQSEALRILESKTTRNDFAIAIAKRNLAASYVAMGQLEMARSLLIDALTILSTTASYRNSELAVTFGNFAYLEGKAGNFDLAMIFQKNAVNVFQLLRQRVATLDRSDLQTYTESIQAHYQLLAEWLAEAGRLPEAQQVLDMLKEDEQFDFIRRSATADPRRTRMGYTPIEQQWMDRYQAIANQLAALGAEERELAKAAKLGLNAQQQARQKALQADLAVARKAFDAYMADLQAAFATKGVARNAEVAETSVKATHELQALIRSLGDGVVLLQMYLTDDQVNLLLTTPGVQLARSAKVPVKELNSQIAALRRALRDPGSQPLPQAQALYRLLLGPVEADLAQAGAKTVMVSLDGTLRYLPIGALHDGKQYAAQKWALPLYTSVVKDKLRDAPTPQWQAAGLGVTRALGDFTALPAVRGEMSSIIQTRAGASPTQGVVPGEVYLDEAFTAQRLMDVGKRRFELLHVASHFRFSPGTEANSFLLLGDGQQLTLGDLRAHNYRFDQVDLLTLSACDTGLGGGRDEKGREIEGFGVIAQQQGAKAVLATLWPVADKSTAMLMADMYRRRQTQGLSKAEALRQAQLALMAQPQYAHPFYWAPFILMGNWK